MLIICGHYEGIDARVINEICDEEISIGDYVLTGGETAAIPGVCCGSRSRCDDQRHQDQLLAGEHEG
ncbi:MAG: hypothetical protein IJ886_04460 [Prevotella sp.]|nr:hypothetical protein [Prevotella sp.]